MKPVIKVAAIMTLCISFFSTTVSAEEDEAVVLKEKNMAISFEPMGLLNGSIPLTFRIKLFDHFSLGLSGYDKVFSFTEVDVTGIGGGLSAKFHLSAPAFENGWYLKPEAMVGYWTVGDDDKKTAGYGVEPKLLAGYDWVWKNGFNLSLGAGVKYLYYTGNKSDIKDVNNFGFAELFPNIDLGIGWAF